MKEKCFKLCHILIVVAVILTSVNLSVFFGSTVSAQFSKTTLELGMTSVVDKARLVKITSWDSDTCEFKAERNGKDITAHLLNNLTTYGTNICNAAESSATSGTPQTADLGWAGEIIGYFGWNSQAMKAADDTYVFKLKKGNGVIDFILLDSNGFNFCKTGLPKMLGYEALQASIAVYEFIPTKALEPYVMTTSTDSVSYMSNCKKAGLKPNFNHILNPVNGKQDKRVALFEAKDFQFIEQNGEFKFVVAKQYVAEAKRLQGGSGEDSFAMTITKKDVKGEEVATGTVGGTNYTVAEENYIITRLLPVVYISELTKESDSSYSIYKSGSNQTIVNANVCTPEVTGAEVYKFDTGTNRIYKYNEGTGEATEVTDVAKMQLPQDMLYICNFHASDTCKGAGIVFREMFEVVNYTLEGVDYTDFTGRKIILDGASGINPDKATGSMVTSTMENLKPKWYLSDFKFTCGFDETYGVTIQLKGKYAEDSGLSEWINSEQGEKALNNLSVDIERLKKGLSSVLSLNIEDRFSWWDIQRFDEISDELSRGKQAKVYNIAFMICMVGGILIIVYSILLIVCFFIDIMNPFTERSLYNLLTFGRVMPLPTQEDVDSMGGESGGTKYISHRGMITSFITGVVVGIILLNSRNIYIFIVNTYHWVLSWF